MNRNINYGCFDPAFIEQIRKKIGFVVNDITGVKANDLFSKSRKGSLRDVRHLIIDIVRKNSTYTVKMIGEIFNREHTVCSYSDQRTIDILYTEPQMRIVYQKMENAIRSQNILTRGEPDDCYNFNSFSSVSDFDIRRLGEQQEKIIVNG